MSQHLKTEKTFLIDSIGDTVESDVHQRIISRCPTPGVLSRFKNLSIVELDSISIPSQVSPINDVININQNFTFHSNYDTPRSAASTQTYDDYSDTFEICSTAKISSAITMPDLSNVGKTVEFSYEEPAEEPSRLASISHVTEPSTSHKKNTKDFKIFKNPLQAIRRSLLKDFSNAEKSNSNFSGQTQREINAMIEKLQSDQWEKSTEGLVMFSSIGRAIDDWTTETGIRYSAIVSRKLIDLLRSLRSNVCKIACQISGDYFEITKSSRLPQFEDLTSLLLLKCADYNKFIRLDAYVALEKMTRNISHTHSIRAICASKVSNHRNPLTRSAVAKLLLSICQDVGNHRILGADANQRIRKLVLENLAELLVDKDQDTRHFAEKLCKFLKTHDSFMEHFIKQFDSRQKPKYMKILSNL